MEKVGVLVDGGYWGNVSVGKLSDRVDSKIYLRRKAASLPSIREWLKRNNRRVVRVVIETDKLVNVLTREVEKQTGAAVTEGGRK